MLSGVYAFCLRGLPVLSLVMLLSFVYSGKLSADVRFIENEGQWKEHILYKADLPSGKLFVGKTALSFVFADNHGLKELHHTPCFTGSIDAHAFRIHFADSANTGNFSHRADEPFSTKYNYFIGNDPEKWASDVNAYNRVMLEDVQPGIDLELIGKGGHIKYNIYLDEARKNDDFALHYEGVDELTGNGTELEIETSVKSLIEEMPLVYQPQESDDLGGKKRLDANFYVDKSKVSFNIKDEIDPDAPLVIDPNLIFSTYSGSYADNFGYTGTFDHDGNGYAAGAVFDMGFPVTTGAFQVDYLGGQGFSTYLEGTPRNIGVLKFNDKGSQLEYATYLGGAENNDDPHSIIVNSQNELVIYGSTYSEDYPVTNNAFDTSFNDSVNMVLTILEPDGSALVGSTFIGGSLIDGRNGTYIEEPNHQPTNPLNYNYGDLFRGEVMVDSNDNVLVAGMTSSHDFPVTSGAYQTQYPGGNQSGVVFKMNRFLTDMEWGTFLGGSNEDALYGIRINEQGEVYVAGGTNSSDFPATSDAYQSTFNGEIDGILTRLAPGGTNVLNSTYIGTNEYDQSYFLDFGPDGDVYVTGQTEGDFPVIYPDSVFSIPSSGQFLARFDAALTELRNSTVFGLEDADPALSPSAFMVDTCGLVYFSGWGGSLLREPLRPGNDIRDMPVTENAFQTRNDINSGAFYLAMFNNNFSELLYGSFFGGNISGEHVDGGTSRFDENGVVYQAVCAGCWGNDDFPTTDSAYSRVNASNDCNNALFKMDFNTQPVTADFEIPELVCKNDTVTIINNSNRGVDYQWDFGNGETSDEMEPQIIYDSPGIFTVELVVLNEINCLVTDTLQKEIEVYDNADAAFKIEQDVCSDLVSFKYTGEKGRVFEWHLNEKDTFREENFSKKLDDGTHDIKLIVDDKTMCIDSSSLSYDMEPFIIPDWEVGQKKCTRNTIFEFTGHHNDGIAWEIDSKTIEGKYTEYEFENSGTFQISLMIDTEGKCTDTVKFPVQVTDLPAADFDYNQEPCAGDVDFTFTGIADSVGWIINNEDSLSGFQAKHVYEDTGYHELSVIAFDEGGCADTLTKNIYIDEILRVGFDYQQLECENHFGFKNLSYGGNHYQWYIDGNPVDKDSHYFEHHFDDYGQKEIRLEGETDGICQRSVSSVINVDTFPVADFKAQSDECPQTFHFEADGDSVNNFLWKVDGNFVSNNKEFEYTFSSPGGYGITLILEPDSICADTSADDIVVQKNPVADFTAELNQCSGVIEIRNYSVAANEFLWIFRNDSSFEKEPSFSLQESGDYDITLIADPELECADTVNKELEWGGNSPSSVEVPNVFTPNDDGFNEILKLKGLEDACMELEWMIFNRWGEKVYEADEPPFEWDGRVGDQKSEPGTYYFILRGNGWEKSGEISLIR